MVVGKTTATREWSQEMKIACLCPTYRARPATLVGNSIACFEAQTHEDSVLCIYDDTGHFEPATGENRNWELVVKTGRHPTLSAKYNRMVEWTHDADAYVVWEDDDIYLPWHVESCVAALQRGPWAHPSRVLSLYGGTLHEEGAAGRFHAALAFRRDALAEVGGWPDTARGDFDQQLIRNLRDRFGPPADPLDDFQPSYVFRWGSTGCTHGQSLMRGAEDEQWYRRAEELEAGEGRVVAPVMDEETRGIFIQVKGARCGT